jgi:hypothetical protein
LQREGLIDGNNKEEQKSIAANSHQMLAQWLPPAELQISVTRSRKPFFSESGVDAFDSAYKQCVPPFFCIIIIIILLFCCIFIL